MFLQLTFGSFDVFCQAAGLDPEPKIKLTNEIFQVDLEKHLKDYSPFQKKPKIAYADTLVLGDVHFPFTLQWALDEIYKYAEKRKPKRIIQVGDLYDMYAHSKFPRSLNIYTPNQEEDLARKMAEDMWKTLLSIAPNAECVQIMGNHDIRPVRRTLEVQPTMERAASRHVQQLMTFDGVKLIADSRQEYFFDDIMVLHGYGSKSGQHRDYNQMNVIKGHNHKGYTVFKRIREQTLWELDPGFLGDPEAKAFGYTAQKNHDMTTGFGWVDESGPRFIAL